MWVGSSCAGGTAGTLLWIGSSIEREWWGTYIQLGVDGNRGVGYIRGMTSACTRCHGTGSLPGYRFIDGGRCWGCMGAGTRDGEAENEYWTPVRSVRIERRPSLGGPIDIQLATLNGVYRVSVHDEKVMLNGDPHTAWTVTEFDTLAEARRYANARFAAKKEAVAREGQAAKPRNASMR